MKRLCCFLYSVLLAIVVNGQNNLILPPMNVDMVYEDLNFTTQNDTVMELNFPITISGLSVSGIASLNHTSNSLVRITLQDNYNTEMLVYEVYPLLADSSVIVFENMAFESAVLDNITAVQLNIKIVNATLQLDKISLSTEPILNAPSLQDSVFNSTSSYYIDRLNQKLVEKEIPWVAGRTSISHLSYEDKKALFGGEVPNLGGFEYYVGGIFVSPEDDIDTVNTTTTASSLSFPLEWDWRNRHGKNWLTSVKDQGICGSCWAFATIGAVEAYANLYYNSILNLDLSEQELLSCNNENHGCSGGFVDKALDYIIGSGIIDEESFLYSESDGDCDNKPAVSNEQFWINDYGKFTNKSERDLKSCLIKSPMTVGIKTWKHALVLVGYKVLEVGDTVYNSTKEKIIIKEKSSLVGTTAWLVKNSYGDSWGDHGYGYISINVARMTDSGTCYIKGDIVGLNYDDNVINIADADGDGYYFWGIGNRPENIPSWAQEEADGDDSNPLFGPLDTYGNLMDISLDSYPDIIINTEVVWNEDSYIYNNVRIVNGGRLIVSADVRKFPTSSIAVENGGELIVNTGSIIGGDIVVKNNGQMTIARGGEIRLSNSNDFQVEKGGILNQSFGKINVIDKTNTIGI